MGLIDELRKVPDVILSCSALCNTHLCIGALAVVVGAIPGCTLTMMWVVLLLVDIVMGGGFGSHLASPNSPSDPLALHIVGGGDVFMDLCCASQVQEICKGKMFAQELANFCGPSPRCRREPTNFDSALHGWAGGKDWALQR